MCTAVALEVKNENMLKSETQAVGFIKCSINGLTMI